MGDTPESEVPASWMGCSIYQNYTASEVLVQVRLCIILNLDIILLYNRFKCYKTI